jgi:alkylhydroperoxidase family enzyme
MTRQVQVSDATFARVRAVLGSDQQVFEIVGVTAAYNMVARILVALRLQP